MLTPEYLLKFTDTLLGMYDQLDTLIISDIARRIAKAGAITETAAYQIRLLTQQGILLSDVQKMVAQVNAVADIEVERLFHEAAQLGLINDAKHIGLAAAELSGPMQQIAAASIAKTSGELHNLTMTTAVTAMDKLEKAMTAAEMMVESGAFSYDTAIRRCILDMAASGTTVTYPSGHVDQLDVAVRRAVLTGVGQTTGKLTELYAEENGVEYYEVTAHSGARPSHAEWQGKVYKIHGADDDFPNFVEETGYGSGEGLCGYNCRHSFFPYVPGVSKRAYTEKDIEEYSEKKYEYNGRQMTDYEVNQEMRKRERGIRAQKRELAAQKAAAEATANDKLRNGLQEDLQAGTAELKQKEKEYRQFCKETSHTPDSTRTQVVAVQGPDGNVIKVGRVKHDSDNGGGVTFDTTRI